METNLREQYYEAIKNLQFEQDIIDAMPKPEYESFYSIMYGLIELITKELEKNPQILPEILDELEITELEFLDYISGNSQANITLYDQTLTLIKTKTKKNIHPKEITKY